MLLTFKSDGGGGVVAWENKKKKASCAVKIGTIYRSVTSLYWQRCVQYMNKDTWQQTFNE